MSTPASSLILCLLITLMPFARSSEASSCCASTRFIFLYDEVRALCPICVERALPLEVTGESLDKELSVSGAYYSVLFYASWCPFSRNMQPIFDALSSMFPHIRHLAVEESSASPSVFARYGVHSFPALILAQQATRIWYHGSNDLYSLVQFYRENTGLEPVSYFTFDKLHNSEKVAPLRPWNGSIKEIIGNEPYLTFAVLFICMKTFIRFFPAIASCLKDFFMSNVWRLKLGIFGEWNHLLEKALDIVDIKKLRRKRRFCDKSKNLHAGTKSARVLASSLASVSLGFDYPNLKSNHGGLLGCMISDIIGVEPSETSIISGENPGYVPSILDVKLLDEVMKISTAEAVEVARTLVLKEGLLVNKEEWVFLQGLLQLLLSMWQKGLKMLES